MCCSKLSELLSKRLWVGILKAVGTTASSGGFVLYFANNRNFILFFFSLITFEKNVRNEHQMVRDVSVLLDEGFN